MKAEYVDTGAIVLRGDWAREPIIYVMDTGAGPGIT